MTLNLILFFEIIKFLLKNSDNFHQFHLNLIKFIKFYFHIKFFIHSINFQDFLVFLILESFNFLIFLKILFLASLFILLFKIFLARADYFYFQRFLIWIIFLLFFIDIEHFFLLLLLILIQILFFITLVNF